MHDTPPPLRSLGVALLVTILAGSAVAAGLPLMIELDGCVMPAPACADTRNVVTLRDNDRKIPFAVDVLRLRSTTRATTGAVLTEMKLRPQRVHGPDELMNRLTPGARLRVRAAVRLREMYMLLQSVEPLPEKHH
jgi:hypothetical protein